MTYNSIDPAHYRGDRKYEPIAVIEDWGLNYRLGNAVKYISRNGRKPGEDPREGLKKAIWYLQREIASLDNAAPYGVTYEDVLQDYAACASEGYDLRQALDDQYALWDDSLGPMEPHQEDYLGGAEWDYQEPAVKEAVKAEKALWGSKWCDSCEVDLDELHKDLDQFEEDEIASTFERRGIIFGVDRLGKTYILGTSEGYTK